MANPTGRDNFWARLNTYKTRFVLKISPSGENIKTAAMG